MGWRRACGEQEVFSLGVSREPISRRCSDLSAHKMSTVCVALKGPHLFGHLHLGLDISQLVLQTVASARHGTALNRAANYQATGIPAALLPAASEFSNVQEMREPSFERRRLPSYSFLLMATWLT